AFGCSGKKRPFLVKYVTVWLPIWGRKTAKTVRRQTWSLISPQSSPSAQRKKIRLCGLCDLCGEILGELLSKRVYVFLGFFGVIGARIDLDDLLKIFDSLVVIVFGDIRNCELEVSITKFWINSDRLLEVLDRVIDISRIRIGDSQVVKDGRIGNGRFIDSGQQLFRVGEILFLQVDSNHGEFYLLV